MNYKNKIFLPYLMASHFCSATVVLFQLVVSLFCSENLFRHLHGQPCVNVKYLPIILLEASWASCTRDVCKPLCPPPPPPIMKNERVMCNAHRGLKLSELTTLKPTGHVVHHQFNIQQLYALPTLYLCVLYLSENKQRLVPLTA